MRIGIGRKRETGRYLLTACCVIMLLLCPVTESSGADKKFSEYKIKAACLYNFLKFVRWPDSTADQQSENVTIGIIGDDPFGEHFSSIEGKLVKSIGKTLVIRRFGRFDAATDHSECRLLFIAGSESSDFARILSAIKGTSILTVADSDGFLKAGGMINLVKEKNQIRWQINRTAANKAELKLNAQLLRTASKVIETEE